MSSDQNVVTFTSYHKAPDREVVSKITKRIDDIKTHKYYINNPVAEF